MSLIDASLGFRQPQIPQILLALVKYRPGRFGVALAALPPRLSEMLGAEMELRAGSYLYLDLAITLKRSSSSRA